MRFVVGDIHGEVTKLKNLLKQLEKYQVDELIFIGDYVDKGEDIKGTLELLQKLSHQVKCQFLMGNHEANWLKFLKGAFPADRLKKIGGLQTLAAFGLSDFNPINVKKAMIDAYPEIFAQLKLYYETDQYFIVHGGLNFDKVNRIGLEQADFECFCPNPRQIFLNTQRKFRNKPIVFGHTAFYSPYVDQYKIGIDTGAVYLPTAPLTAFNLEENFFINDQGSVLYSNQVAPDVCPMIIRVRAWRQSL